MEIRKLAAIALISLSTTSAYGQVHFWMSANDVAAGSPAPLAGQTPELELPLGASGEINIWVRPESGKTLENFSLNVESTSETAIEFQSAVIANDGRFSEVFDSTSGLDVTGSPTICGFDEPLHSIWGLAGFSFGSDGGTGLNSSSPGDDPNYDATNNSWLLATIGYRAAELGSTDLYLEIGQIGINQRSNRSGKPESSSATTVLLGDPSDPSLSGGFLARCERSSTSEATIHVVESLGLLGDFNMNGVLDPPDIDLLSAEVIAGTNNEELRVDANALVDQADRVVWVEDLKKSRFGDTDLNGTVEFVDFLVMSSNFGLPGGWANGDFTGDGKITFEDFLTLSVNFGLSGSAAHPVPEPNASLLLLSGFVAALRLRRRR